MARHSLKVREEARQFFLTGEVTSIAEIARRIKVKPHTIGTWKKEENWDSLKIKIDRRAAEQLVERLATERVNLNATHFKLWNNLIGRILGALQKEGIRGEDIRNLEKVAAALEKAQKGQRLARGLSLDGETEEAILARAEAETRALVDLFIDLVKQHVPDEETRDRIARGLYERAPMQGSEGEEEGDDSAE